MFSITTDWWVRWFHHPSFYYPWYNLKVGSVARWHHGLQHIKHGSCSARVLHVCRSVSQMTGWGESMLQFNVFSYGYCTCWLILQCSRRQKLILWDVCENFAVTTMCFAQNSSNTCRTRLDHCSVFWFRNQVSLVPVSSLYSYNVATECE